MEETFGQGSKGREGRVKGRKKTGVELQRRERFCVEGWSVVSGGAGKTRRRRTGRKFLDINCVDINW